MQNQQVYIHAIGLGLGAWELFKGEDHKLTQTKLMLEVYKEVLENNKDNFEHISDINFSWMDEKAGKAIGLINEETVTYKNHTIKIHFSKRDHADELTGDDAGKLLVAMYAWDGNAYPGNEYFWKKTNSWDPNPLTASGDPAAACCSLIASLQNPRINPYIKENIKELVQRLSKQQTPDTVTKPEAPETKISAQASTKIATEKSIEPVTSKPEQAAPETKTLVTIASAQAPTKTVTITPAPEITPGTNRETAATTSEQPAVKSVIKPKPAPEAKPETTASKAAKLISTHPRTIIALISAGFGAMCYYLTTPEQKTQFVSSIMDYLNTVSSWIWQQDNSSIPVPNN